jgi:pyroglutamyl-peptidase
MPTILITGFGPFPGAPHNPTAVLAEKLARARRPHLRLVGHVFAAQYHAVDRELPALIEQHRPDALLMFGLHGRARTLRIETVARNALSRHADAGGKVPNAPMILRGAPPQLRMATPGVRLLHAARSAGVKAELSRDAGSYLCNYLCWQATSLIGGKNAPRLAAFIHVPPVARAGRSGHGLLGPVALDHAAAAILGELARCLGSAGNRY